MQIINEKPFRRPFQRDIARCEQISECEAVLKLLSQALGAASRDRVHPLLGASYQD